MPLSQEHEQFAATEQGGLQLPLIGRFPREFEKHFGDRFDKRFMGILLSSIVVHLLFVIYVALNPPSREASQSEIDLIQKRFANLVLDQAPPDETVNLAEQPLETRASEESEPEAKEAGSATKPDVAKRSASAEGRKEQRTVGAEVRRRTREQIKQEVSNQGILGLLTSTSSAAAGAEVEDVLGKGSVAQDLDKALSGVSGLRRAQSGEAGKTGERDVRGTRATGSSGIDDLVEGLGKSAAGGVSRSGEVMVEGATALLEEEGGEARRGGRNIDEVSAIVKTHNSAIQYCYQRVLKRTPNLRGKVVVRFTIAPSGSVKNVEIVSSTLKNSRVESCIVSRIQRWNDFGAVDPSKGDTTFRQVYSFGY